MRLWAPVLALVLGCGASRPSREDCDWPRAAGRWYAATGLQARPSSVRVYPGPVPCGPHWPAAGCRDRADNAVRLAWPACPALHELGHVLGASHGPPGTVMAPRLEGAGTCLTGRDVAAVPGKRWAAPECP